MLSGFFPSESEATLPKNRILVLTADFSTSVDDRWLMDDLVDAFVAKGAQVDVVVFDNKRIRPRGVSIRNGHRVRVISVGPARLPKGRLDKAWSYLYSAALLHTRVYRLVRNENYDLALFTSIGVISAGLPARIRGSRIAKRLVFLLWDFFPVHQMEIGRLPKNALTESLRLLELSTFKNADHVAVMSPSNARFFSKYHPEFSGKTMILPPWAQSPVESYEIDKKLKIFTAIFGGQLVAGRGVETLIDAAHLLEMRKTKIQIIVAGEGPLKLALEEKVCALRLTNVRFLGALPRPIYRDVLRSAHVGVAATVSGVTVPSFPSKIVEYCRASLPVIACLEDSTDAGELLENSGAGISVAANDAEELAIALERMEGKHRSGELVIMARAAGEYFSSSLSDVRAAQTILASGEASTFAQCDAD